MSRLETRRSIFVVGVALVALGAWSTQSRLAQALGGDALIEMKVDDAARRILAYADANLPSCYRDLSGPQAPLTRALVGVEYAMVDPGESIVERVVLALHSLGLDAGDFSVGPAQVRLSTAVTLSRRKGDSQSTSDVARTLSDDCANIRTAQEIVVLAGGPETTCDPVVVSAYIGETARSLPGAIHHSLVRSICRRLSGTR